MPLKGVTGSEATTRGGDPDGSELRSEATNLLEEDGREIDKVSFPLKIEEVKRDDGIWKNITGAVLVNIYEPEEKFRIGDRLEINGSLRPPPFPRNPSDFDYGVYLLRRGIVGQVWIGEGDAGKILSRDNINFIKRIAARGRDWMEKIIDLGPYGGRESLLKGILMGKREELDETLKANFINTGTIHIIAISGLNLVIVTAIILFICKIIFLPEIWTSIVSIAFLAIYVFLTGGRASVVRAAIMAGVFLGGKFFIRQTDKWTSLSLASLIILSLSPQELFDSGFQMTFMAVGGLMSLYPAMENVLKKRVKWLFNKPLACYFIKSILAILAAQIALGPFLVYYYYLFPLTLFIANLIIVPILSAVTILGFVSSLAGIVSFSLARAFNATNSIFLLIMDKTASFLGNLPGTITYLPQPSPLLFLFYYAILFLIFYPVKKISLT